MRDSVTEPPTRQHLIKVKAVGADWSARCSLGDFALRDTPRLVDLAATAHIVEHGWHGSIEMGALTVVTP